MRESVPDVHLVAMTTPIEGMSAEAVERQRRRHHFGDSHRCDSCNQRRHVNDLIHCREGGVDFYYCEDCYAP